MRSYRTAILLGATLALTVACGVAYILHTQRIVVPKDESKWPVKTHERHLEPDDVVFIELVCLPEENRYRLYNYKETSRSESFRIRSMSRALKEHPNVRWLGESKKGIFVNGERIDKDTLLHECSLPSGTKVTTIVNFNKPIVTETKGVSVQSTGLTTSMTSGPITIEIMSNSTLLARIPDMFFGRAIDFTAGTLRLCSGFDISDRCQTRTTDDLLRIPYMGHTFGSFVIS